MRKLIAIITLALTVAACNKIEKNQTANVYFGTYTKKEGHVDGKGEGIYRAQFNMNTGELSDLELIASAVNPSFISASKDGKNIFAVIELGPGDEKFGEVISIVKEGKTNFKIVDTESSFAYAPCHLEFDSEMKNLFTANYMNGVITLHQIENDGKITFSDSLNFDLKNDVKSHLHQAVVRKDKVYVPDLGKDKIWIISFDKTKGQFYRDNIMSIEIEEGSGPRHIVVSDNENTIYVVSEYSNTVDVFKTNKSGVFIHQQRLSTLPEEFDGTSYCAEIVEHPNKSFIYASNRGHNSVAAMEKTENGLKLIGIYTSFGDFPRSINISPDGKHLLVANQNSDNLYIYKIDQNSGELIESGLNYEIPTPVDIEF
jgi:6-phosphogluconolactonase